MSTANTTANKRTSRGRQKIEIKQLEKRSTKEVTFSKRRAGLFKKAGELCILCGAEVGIIVFSPARKPYCFGHPNVETIVNRYLSNNNTTYETAMINLPVHEYNQAYEKSVKDLKEEKKRGLKANDKSTLKSDNDMQWLDEDVENIKVDEIHDYLTALQNLRKKVVARYESLRIESNSAMMFNNPFSQLGFGVHRFGNRGLYFNGGPATSLYGGPRGYGYLGYGML